MTTTGIPEARYRIADVSRRSGFSASTLRYYEQSGVLAAPERTPAGYRLYTDRDLERLRLIARAKDLGCTLDESAELLRAWEGGECGPVKHRLLGLVRDKVAEVHVHLAEQAAFAEQLRATADVLAARPLDGPCDETCGCTTSFDTDAMGSDEIACSLSGVDMATSVADWQQLLGDVTSRAPVTDGLRLEFDEHSVVAELARLVDAEQACCPFFSFAITIDHRGLALEVTAPPDGQDVLAAVFGERR